MFVGTMDTNTLLEGWQLPVKTIVAPHYVGSLFPTFHTMSVLYVVHNI